MSGKSSLSCFRSPETIFAVTGILDGVVVSPFYNKPDWAGEWTPPQPQTPSGSEENWFKSAGLLTFSNAHSSDSGGFEASNKLFIWEVATALDLRGYSGSFTFFCRFTLDSSNYSGTVWRQGADLNLSIADGEKLSISLPFITESGEKHTAAATLAVEPLPSGVFITCAVIWDDAAKQLRVYLNSGKIADISLPEAVGISEELSSGQFALGGGGDLAVYHWSMFSAALSEDALAALNCGLG